MNKASIAFKGTMTALAGLAASLAAEGAVSYTTPGQSYTQDFNSLSGEAGSHAWANNSTIGGWYGAQGTTNRTLYEAAAGGGGNQGDLLSLGASGSGDRALGGQSPDSGATMYLALSLSNASGSDMTAFTLSYAGEQWRAIANEVADQMSFQYQVFAAGTGDITLATGWTSVPTLGFVAPVTVTSSGAVNGNTAGQVPVTGTVSGISWGNGQELWLRWSDENPGGSGQTRAMLGIDDVNFSAVPEPGSLLLSAFGVGALLFRRRVS